jgi:pimeloyl-ACP methyl ester carboxylesterase
MTAKNWSGLRLVSGTFGVLQRVSPRLASELGLMLMLMPGRSRVKTWDQPVLDEAQRFHFDFAGKRLAGYRWGSEKPCVVLVHGWGSRASRLSAFVRPLQEKGVSVVAFDAPGHGESEGRFTHPLDFSAAVRSFVEHTGDVQGLIAHSFGAACTLMAMNESCAVNRIVVLSGPCGFAYALDLFASIAGLSEEVIERMRARLLARFGAVVDVPGFLKMLAGLKPCGLIVHDRGDSVVPFRHGELVASGWRSAQLLATEGLGHEGILCNADVVRSVVTFLLES